MDWGIGDLLAVTKLAWELYHNCFLAAKEAPDEFRHLVQELGTLRGILKNLSDDANSDESLLKNLDQGKKELLDRSLRSCVVTLRRLHKLLANYKVLGLGEGLQFWRRISWTTKKKEIIDMKAAIQGHATTIQLCLTSVQNSSLARIEAKLLPALERLDSNIEDDLPGPVLREVSEEPEISEMNRLPPLSREQSPAMNSPDDTMDLTRRATERSFVEMHNRSPSFAVHDGEDLSPTNSASRHGRNTSLSFSRHRRTSSNNTNTLSNSPTRLDEDTRAHARTLLDQLPARFSRPQPSPQPPPQPSPRQDDSVDITSEVSYATQELSKVQEEEQSTRPLRIPPQRNIPRPDERIVKVFQESAQEEMQYRKLNMRDWLRIGTWWLLKAKYNLNSVETPLTASSTASTTTKTTHSPASRQGFVDLLKVSWIVFQVVLSGDQESNLRSEDSRNVLYNLVDGLAHESRAFRVHSPDDVLADTELSFDIWENMQALEEDFGDEFGGLYNSRWVTLQQGDAGRRDERALFRTFVDASFGGREHNVFPKGAPYLLILSTREGESEPKISLCNQSGTMCLTKDFTIEDLENFTTNNNPVLDLDHYEDLQSMPLSFGDRHTSVSFPRDSDLQRFVQLPTAYFDTVKRREPRSMSKATEVIIFKSSLDIVDQLNSATQNIMSTKHHWESCHIRILETTCKEGWRTTRRLVLSSSAGEKQPWCNEFFLPTDGVQLKSDTGNQVIMKWSDCSQEDYTQTNGQYMYYYSHVYNDEKPNNALRLVFNSVEDSSAFQAAILSMSSRHELYSWQTRTERGHIYEMEDTDPKPMKYKAIMLITTLFDWTYAHIFYHYRHTDFRLESTSFRLHFPLLSYTHYQSSHYKELYKPEKTPVFSYCEKKTNPLTLDFTDLNMASAFLTCLSSGAKVTFTRRALHLSTKPPSRLGGSTKSNKGAVEVLVWQVGNKAKVVSRWSDLVSDKWVTVDLQRDSLRYNPDDNRASLPAAKYDRAQKLDIEDLQAVGPKNKETGARREGYLTWTFSTSRDQEEFVAAVEGKSRDPYKALDEYVENL